ncbi:MAG: hypothetical protein JNL21_00600 [Myxococcales bacterium]|nr:hypothetical protein [Myxococcales bacterium]
MRKPLASDWALLVHFRVLALGGVYVRDADGELVFHALAPPTSDEVTEVAVRTAKRPQKVLARHGRLLEDRTVDPSPGTEQLELRYVLKTPRRRSRPRVRLQGRPRRERRFERAHPAELAPFEDLE